MRAPLPTLLPWAPLPALLLATWAAPGASLQIPWLLLGMQFGLDATGRIFLLFSAILWLFAGLQARDQLADAVHGSRFAGLFLATMAGNLLLILAQDLAGFYLGYALMTFAAYGLIVHKGSAEARQAGRIYMVMAVLGEALLLLAFLQLAQRADSLLITEARAALAAAPAGGTLVALLVAGFGIKAGALLLHLWLPLAHPVAPVPASAVLSGVLIKAGLLGWLRFLPLGLAESPWGFVLLVAGLAAAFYGVALGLAQRAPKVILAYSSISQMGLMTLGVGLGLAYPEAWPLLLPAVTLFALHHALTKGALFLGLGLAGPGRHGVLAGLGLLAASLAGAPLLGGALAKQALKPGVLHSPWEAWLLPLLALSSLATTLLMARLLWRLARSDTPGWAAPPPRAFRAWWLLVLLALTGAWWLPGLVAPQEQSPAALWAATWPVLGGGLLAWSAGRAWRRSGRPWPALPPGDLLWPLLRLGTRVTGRARWPLRGQAAFAWRPPRPRWPKQLETRLHRSRVQGMLLLLGIGLLLALLATD